MKFLGYIIFERGIEAKSEKIKAILEMEEPKCINDVQKLNGQVTTLRRFISYSVKRYIPFFKALKEKNNFV